MVCSSPALRAQGQPSSGEGERRTGQPDLLWLAELTGAHLGLAPISQDPEDRCSIWENLVSLVDFQCPGFPLTSEELRHYIDIPRAPAPSSAAVTVTLPRALAWPPPLPGDVDYKTNAQAKPPYSYATLICMAMEASEKPKLTLAAICKWIRDNFCYFRRAHPSWQSSIRHNLCINKRFVKVPREKGEPGRGAFWKLHPQYAEWLKSSSTSEGRRELPEPVPGAQPGGAGSHLSPTPRSSSGRLEVGAELQRLLREFEEFESSQKPSGSEAGQQHRPAAPPAQGSAPPGCASSGSPQELTELKGSADWEALLNLSPEQGDSCALQQLPAVRQAGAFPLLQPARAQGQPPGWPRGEQQQQQVLLELGPTKAGLDETLMATAFLEAAWGEESRENLPGCVPVEQGAENSPTSLPGGDALGWDSLAPLDLY